MLQQENGSIGSSSRGGAMQTTVVRFNQTMKMSRKTRDKRLVALIICLACWAHQRIAPSYELILLESKNQELKESNLLAPVQTFHTNTTQITIRSPLKHPNFTFDFPLCLVHVGKAAGSSLSCGLGLMYADCEGMPRDPPLPSTYYFHMKKDTCRPVEMEAIQNNRQSHIATFLMPVRNPLMRIQSWFNFEKDIIPIRRNKEAEERIKKKRGMLFSDCYDNFVDLVVHGLTPNLWNANVSAEQSINMTCPERAWAAILGVRDFSYHEWYNYEYYWTALQDRYPRLFQSSNGTLSTAKLLVLRTEHLFDDWARLSKEDLYRQVNQGSRVKSRTVATTSQSTVSVTIESREKVLGDQSAVFWRNLCHAMCPELQIYKEILWHGRNLDESQVYTSIHELQTMCPKEGNIVRSCPGIPKFPSLRIPRRQYKTEVKKRLFTIG
jgi:hypothetical protein